MKTKAFLTIAFALFAAQFCCRATCVVPPAVAQHAVADDSVLVMYSGTLAELNTIAYATAEVDSLKNAVVADVLYRIVEKGRTGGHLFNTAQYVDYATYTHVQLIAEVRWSDGTVAGDVFVSLTITAVRKPYLGDE